MKIRYSYLLLFVLLVPFISAYGQSNALVRGKVTDGDGKPLELVNVAVVGTSIGTSTSGDGTYQIRIPADTTIIVDFSFVGYDRQQFQVTLTGGAVRELDVELQFTSTDLRPVEIRDQQVRYTNYIRIDPKIRKMQNWCPP
jgi:hypothetical protein